MKKNSGIPTLFKGGVVQYFSIIEEIFDFHFSGIIVVYYYIVLKNNLLL